MIASVQYNDLRGTAAADVSDFYMNSLQNYLKENYTEFDNNRYICHGCTIWVGNSGQSVNLSFICYDKNEDKHVKFYPIKSITFEEAFGLFKRFEVVMGVDINEIEVKDVDYIDLK